LLLREKGESFLSFWEMVGVREKKLAMQEVIAKALFPTAVFRFIPSP
jgi:hypothetical protein